MEAERTVPCPTAIVDVGQYAGVAALVSTVAGMHDDPDGADHALCQGLGWFAALDARCRATDYTVGLYGGLVMTLGRMTTLFSSPPRVLPASRGSLEAALRGMPARSADAEVILTWTLECADQDDHEPFYRRVAAYLVSGGPGLAVFEAAAVLLYVMSRESGIDAAERWLTYGLLLHAVDRVRD